MARVPGGFGINDVMGVGRRSRAVDLSDAQRRALEQMALQQQEQAMFEQAGLGRADEPYSDPLKGAWDKVVNAEIPLDKVPGWDMPGWDSPIPALHPGSAFMEGGPKGLAEWLNMVKYMSMPLMPSDFGASGEHANTPLVGAPKVIGTGVGLGILGARAAKRPLRSLLARLGRGGDEAVDAGTAAPRGWLGERAAASEGRQAYAPGPWQRDYPGAPRTPRDAAPAVRETTGAQVPRSRAEIIEAVEDAYIAKHGQTGVAAMHPSLRSELLYGRSGVAPYKPSVQRFMDETLQTTEAAGRTSRPYFRNIDELGDAAQPAWPGGPTLFHGGPADMSGFRALGEGNMVVSRPAMGNATYTTPDIQFASQYANRSVEAQGAIFRGTRSPPTPSVVQNVRFTGEGAPRLIDYGKAGIDKEAQQAVLDTISHMDELLGAHPGTSLIHRTELEPLVAKLRDPSTSFDDIHGFASHVATGPKGSTLRETVEAVIRRNTETGPFRPHQLNEMMSIVMSRLSDNLSNAGYHGFVAPSGGAFHLSHVGYHGQKADTFGDSIAWFNPSKDLEILGTAQHNVMGVAHPSTGQLVPSGYRADNWFGSPQEVASRFE